MPQPNPSHRSGRTLLDLTLHNVALSSANMAATTVLESTPPLRKAPMGTSLTMWLRTASESCAPSRSSESKFLQLAWPWADRRDSYACSGARARPPPSTR